MPANTEIDVKADRKILVTSALPYANGPIHLGHLVEYIQTDIWVRYHKFRGREVYYFCADDTHGTPVMIAARKAGISPDDMVAKVHKEHYADLTGFLVEFDNYYTTNSQENKEFSSAIYTKAMEGGHVARRSLEQLYCDHDKMFLPDRFVKGTCPKCGAKDQYGDSCEVCGAAYSPTDLKEPGCSICGTTPVMRKSEHLFFKLADFQDTLREWLDTPGRVDEGIRKKMDEWLDSGLKDWDISRDGPYFGFEIPGEKNKYFYVWLDAPIGYMASSRNYFNKTGQPEKFDRFWNKDSQSEVYHFIGKDIVYFHTLFWPALLHVGGYRTPDAVHVHGFLTLNGEKMSKSRGTLIRARTYLNHLDPEALRFYYASRLTASLDDLDLALPDFVSRYNTEVVGNLTNIFSRLASGIAKKLERKLADGLTQDGENLRKFALESAERILEFYETRSYAKAVREIAGLGDEINRFVTREEPWVSVKTDPEKARRVLTDALTAGRILAGVVGPILPGFSKKVEELLNLPEPVNGGNLEWTFPAGHRLKEFIPLTTRLEEEKIQTMLDEEKKAVEAANQKVTTDAKATEKGSSSDGIITIDDLAKVELKAGKILSAELVEGADRLLRISLDLGEEKPRQVIAGIRVAYDPETLVGMTVVAVANLQPRKMKFGVSEAMLLAAGEGEGLTLFVPHRSAKPGDRLR